MIEAAVLGAVSDGGHVLAEATSNQVDQTGGYTGMRPTDFRDLVLGIADRCGLAADRVLFGGDHLGPNRWRGQEPEVAMARAEELVVAFVAAGFTKLHLDCSFRCREDTDPLTDEVVSRRAARLVEVAERASTERGDSSALRYVIGTEVPTPGGASEQIDQLMPTSALEARATLAAHREALAEHGLMHVWPRILALVVQPGVEFDQMHGVRYRPELTGELQRVLDDEPHMVFEAHSTDYQTDACLTALVHDRWAILKVGPALTFALREAMMALETIERELIDDGDRSRLSEILEARMLAEPDQWRSHHRGGSREQRLGRRFGYSDRLRYYWPDPEVSVAARRLLDNLIAVEVPLPLLSQYLPFQYTRVCEGVVAAHPRALVIDHVGDVLRQYQRAVAPRDAGEGTPPGGS